MHVRREATEDVDDVRTIHVEAFRRDPGSEPVEAGLLDELRHCDGWIPELSLVAELDGRVVGHAVSTRGVVHGEHVDMIAVGLGPIAVSPQLQRAGIGSALMHASIAESERLDLPLIALLGSPEYYSRFGFVASTEVGIEPPDPSWAEYFQVLTLRRHDDSVRGTFEYAEPFSHL